MSHTCQTTQHIKLEQIKITKLSFYFLNIHFVCKTTRSLNLLNQFSNVLKMCCFFPPKNVNVFFSRLHRKTDLKRELTLHQCLRSHLHLLGKYLLIEVIYTCFTNTSEIYRNVMVYWAKIKTLHYYNTNS